MNMNATSISTARNELQTRLQLADPAKFGGNNFKPVSDILYAAFPLNAQQHRQPTNQQWISLPLPNHGIPIHDLSTWIQVTNTFDFRTVDASLFLFEISTHITNLISIPHSITTSSNISRRHLSHSRQPFHCIRPISQ
jgi:hypothetical protein